jgi:uncharacterized protein
MLSKTSAHAEVLGRVAASAGARRNLMPDARIAALCIEHGVREIVTADRDFRRFDGLTVTDPFVS